MLIKILVCIIAALMLCILINIYVFNNIEHRKKKREWEKKANYRVIERKTKDGKNVYYIVEKKDMRELKYDYVCTSRSLGYVKRVVENLKNDDLQSVPKSLEKVILEA